MSLSLHRETAKNKVLWEKKPNVGWYHVQLKDHRHDAWEMFEVVAQE